MPTLNEAGYGHFETGGMFAFYVPTGTPQAVMDKIAADAKAKDYKFSSVIVGIVSSTPFQMRRTQ